MTAHAQDPLTGWMVQVHEVGANGLAHVSYSRTYPGTQFTELSEPVPFTHVEHYVIRVMDLMYMN
jgi:hypothetical protein